MRYARVHWSIWKLGQSLHLRCLNERIRVSAIAPASNPSGNALVTALARKPSDSSSMSLISIWVCFLPAVRLNEGGVGPEPVRI
jgi:hypothetical protein